MDLADLIVEFCLNTIKGMESGFYKTFAKKNTLILTTNVLQDTINGFIIDYLNRTYRSLIVDDDVYITDVFEKMKPYNHSFVCILNIIAQLIKVLVEKMHRPLLQTGSYESYMTSVEQQLHILAYIFRSNMNLSHKCTGIDIRTCDPDKPMFSRTPIQNKQ